MKTLFYDLVSRRRFEADLGTLCRKLNALNSKTDDWKLLWKHPEIELED